LESNAIGKWRAYCVENDKNHRAKGKSMTLRSLRIAAYVASIVIAASAATVANASPTTPSDLIFDLTSNHCSTPADCGAPGTIFGTVELIQNGTTVDTTVHLNSPYAFANTGAVDNLAFKFNATGVVVGDITVNQTVPGQTLVPVGPGSTVPSAPPYNGDGTGLFNFGIFCSTCGGGLSTGFTNDIIFHVANATIADLTAPNNLSNVFVADVGNTTNGATGPIDASGTGRPVPEPGSLLLFGTALAALGLFVGRRRKIV
jgi:hypothetical protein